LEPAKPAQQRASSTDRSGRSGAGGLCDSNRTKRPAGMSRSLGRSPIPPPSPARWPALLAQILRGTPRDCSSLISSKTPGGTGHAVRAGPARPHAGALV